MKDEIETNITMDSKEHLAPSASCDTLSTTAPEAQWNLQMCMPTVKEETVECIDEEVSPCSEDMNPSEHLKSPEYVNCYDSMGFEVEKFKKEIPEDEGPQSDFSINYTMVSENKALLELIDKQEANHENTEGGLSLNINEENENGNYQFIVKMEKPEEDQYILDNTGATSVHYDVLINPQEVECKLCSRIFKNGFNLLRHNNEHIKVEINTPGDNIKVMELHQQQYCNKSFNNHNNMLAHIGDVHTKKIVNGELSGKHFKREPNLKRRVMLLHKQMSSNKVTGYNLKCKYCNVDYKHKDLLYKHMKQCRTGKEGEEMKYKCDSCESTYRSKYGLTMHIKSMHYDCGKTFECWCGKQFRTPINLRLHMKRQHDGKMKDTNNDKVQCDTCQRKFKTKYYLLMHIKTVHYDYGKLFECWCGKQFRTPIHLRNHMRQQHKSKIKGRNNNKVQCDTCHKKFTSKDGLLKHIKNVHYDYGKVFECWCGKQFRTPLNLRNHEKWRHDGNINDTNNDNLTGKKVEEIKYKCDSCEGTYGSKYSLTQHIKSMHYDYGRLFDCWCGKRFRIPRNLRAHMKRTHDGKMKGTSTDKVQCDTCHKKFTSKDGLLTHIKNMHYDYGKVFECCCGKQFRTPKLLESHKRTPCGAKNQVYKCEFCKAVFNAKSNLTKHIKGMHYDYGRTFDCWCGKQFRIPRHLRAHMKRTHDGKMKGTNKDKVQCDTCHKKFTSKDCLLTHIKNVHYDYGKVFECWCGKQFRKPIQLRKHERWRHDGNINDTNNDNLTGKKVEEIKYKCDSCEGTYGSKYSLTQHIKSIHYDYGRTFDCRCGKQFRTPAYLRKHMRQRHDGKMKDTNRDKVQCDTCQRKFKSKDCLLKHIKNIHYDYGKVFDCWCGKQFRTPQYLRKHMGQQHDCKMNDTNRDKIQCETCQRKFKSKECLLKHIKNVHYDYGQVFECWCGKQFRTPAYLSQHMRQRHNGKMKDINNDKVQCKARYSPEKLKLNAAN